MVKLLLSNTNIDVNQQNIFFTCYIHGSGWGTLGREKYPLYMAVENNYYEIVELLLKNPNIDVNIKSRI